MIRIGLVNIDTSHPLAFSKIMRSGNRARYAAVYNDGFRGDDELDAFIRGAGLERRAQSLDELAEISDVGFIQGCNWDLHLKHALPFINRKKPVFIDKPVVGNLADCETLQTLSDSGAVIFGGSSLRYCREISAFLSRPAGERGDIVHVYGTSGVDEFNYGIHIVEAICGLMGEGARSCAFCGRGAAGGKTAETYGISFGDGRSAAYTVFSGTYQPFNMIIMTTKLSERFEIDTAGIYEPLLENIFDYMDGGANRLAPVPAMTEPVKIMLAGKASREAHGAPVALSELGGFDVSFDGALFERGYAAANAERKIYLA